MIPLARLLRLPLVARGVQAVLSLSAALIRQRTMKQTTLGPSSILGALIFMASLKLCTAHGEDGRALALTVTQDKLSVTKGLGKTVRIRCTTDGNPIHWYRQKDNGALERMLYVNSGTTSYDSADYQNFRAEDKGLTLHKDSAETDDEATYYCAAWDTHGDRDRGDTCTKTTPTPE
ncbi:TVC1 protein, partial [Polypterus senegalus]